MIIFSIFDSNFDSRMGNMYEGEGVGEGRPLKN